MKPLTQSELVQALLEAGQPHAVVEIKGMATCHDEDEEHKRRGYALVRLSHKVVGVRSALNKIILEVEE